jgi:hypothetical protein
VEVNKAMKRGHMAFTNGNAEYLRHLMRYVPSSSLYQIINKEVVQNDDLLQGLILSDGVVLILEVSTVQYAPNC